MKTKLIPFAVLALLASSAFAAAPTYLYRLYSPGVKGIATAPVDSLLPTASSAFATWNPADKGTTMALSTGNLTAFGNNGGWTSVRATQGKSSGKWYWESTITGPYGTDKGYLLGGGTNSFYLDSYLGSTGYAGSSFGWFPDKTAPYLNWPGASGFPNPAAGTYAAGTVFMAAMDLDNHAVYFGVNGVWNTGGVPTSGATKTGAVFSGFTGTVFPALSCASVSQSTTNFGATPFKYPVPAGYHAGVFQ